MGQLTLVHCLICGEAQPFPWKKEDRAEHLATHLEDTFMEPNDSVAGLIQDGKNSIPGSISDDWKEIRQDWDVDYEGEDA